MWHEPFWKFSFQPEHFGRLVDVFLAAAITADFERDADRRTRADAVRLGEWNFVSIDEVSGNVVEMVFANYDPAVGTIFPHSLLS